MAEDGFVEKKGRRW